MSKRDVRVGEANSQGVRLGELGWLAVGAYVLGAVLMVIVVAELAARIG